MLGEIEAMAGGETDTVIVDEELQLPFPKELGATNQAARAEGKVNQKANEQNSLARPVP